MALLNRFRILCLSVACLLAPLTAATAQDTARQLRIGVMAPGDGPYDLLGLQMQTALQAFGADHPVAVVEALETCEDGSGEDAALSMVEAGVDVVIGLFCVETILSAMPVLAQSDIPGISLSVRADIVMEEALSREWPLFRMEPSADMEAARIADIIASDWASEPFALIEDGTIYGRDLVETIRLELEEIGITPSFVDNFRPAQELQFGLVRRLASSGVTHVFVGGERSDIAIIARDARQAELDLTFMGGDALTAADLETPLPDGVFAVISQASRLDDQSAAAAIERQLDLSGQEDMRPADGYLLPAYATAEIALAAWNTAIGQDNRDLASVLREDRFSTAIGTVRFGNDQSRDGQSFELMISRDGTFVPTDDARSAPAAGQ
jgi:branched-chain amino acid transport system substrate-binding protein